jgi:hypothetical protein
LCFFPLGFTLVSYIYSSSSHSCYIPCPSYSPTLDRFNYTWRRVQVTIPLVMQRSPPSRHFIPLRSEYSPKHTVLKQPIFSFQCQRPSFAPIQNHKQSYSLQYSKFHVFRQLTRRQKFLGWVY